MEGLRRTGLSGEVTTEWYDEISSDKVLGMGYLASLVISFLSVTGCARPEAGGVRNISKGGGKV